MAAERGSAFLLKIGNGASPPGFTTVAGLKTTVRLVPSTFMLRSMRPAI